MENQKLFEFAETINNEIIEIMKEYDTNVPDTIKQKALEKIKIRLDVLMPIKDLQIKQQQLNAMNQLQSSDFMKNFNLKDLMGALKGVTNE